MPPEWQLCGRCKCDLSAVAPRELASVGAGVTRSTFAASRLAPAPPVPDAGTQRQTSSRPPFEPTAPINVRAGYERLGGVEDAWIPKQRQTKRRRLPIVGFLVMCLVGGAVWFAWQRATAREIPADLISYVEDGIGVEQISATGRYLAMLPFSPKQSSKLLTFSGTALDASFAYSTSGRHVIGIAWFDVPSRIVAAKDTNANLAQLANSYATAERATVTELDFLTMHGFHAVDAYLRGEGVLAKIRVVMVGTRIYVLHAGGTADGAIGFGRLTDSFELEGD